MTGRLNKAHKRRAKDTAEELRSFCTPVKAGGAFFLLILFLTFLTERKYFIQTLRNPKELAGFLLAVAFASLFMGPAIVGFRVMWNISRWKYGITTIETWFIIFAAISIFTYMVLQDSRITGKAVGAAAMVTPIGVFFAFLVFRFVKNILIRIRNGDIDFRFSNGEFFGILAISVIIAAWVIKQGDPAVWKLSGLDLIAIFLLAGATRFILYCLYSMGKFIYRSARCRRGDYEVTQEYFIYRHSLRDFKIPWAEITGLKVETVPCTIGPVPERPRRSESYLAVASTARKRPLLVHARQFDRMVQTVRTHAKEKSPLCRVEGAVHDNQDDPLVSA